MFSSIISVVWCISSVLSLLLKVVLMKATLKDVTACRTAVLQQARNGHKVFILGAIVGLLITSLCYFLGFIKFYVVVVDVVVLVIGFILNIVFLRALRKSTK